jgi:hypothetical protein
MRRPGSTVVRSFAATAPRPHAVPVATAIPTSRPTPQFERHHDVLPPQVDDQRFRQGWLVQDRLHQLAAAGLISREELDTALLWKRAADTMTPSHTCSFSPRVDTSTTARDSGALYRVRAATMLRQCADALGPLRVKLLEACVRDDRSWAEIGRLIGLSDKSTKEYVVEAIQALADWWRGDVVEPPPVIRFRNQPGSL